MSSPSQLYTTIQNTARSFVDGTNPEQPGGNTPTIANSPRTSECLTSFGPSFLVSKRPPLQGAITNDEFVKHMSMMTPMLQTWRIEVQRILVDEHKKEASVLAMYYMTPKGEGDAESRTVHHEISWWLKMTDDGKLVERAIEYVDGAAAARIQELVGEYKKSQGSA